jgi:SAM-dependent methyltransferase
MSSPIAKSDKSNLDKALIAGHQKLSHNHRISRLIELFSNRISSLGLMTPAKILDVGCGDMTLAKGLLERDNTIALTCVDIYPPPTDAFAGDGLWANYKEFDGCTLPYNAESFDAVIFSDVLHHVTPECLSPLLASACRVGRFVLIKDHFEYGIWSRQMLRAMDFVGNYGYGVSVPERYFSPSSFQSVLDASGLKIDHLAVGIQLYEHLPVIRKVLSPRWQFLATCSAKNCQNG